MKRVRQLAKRLKLSSNVKITAAMNSVHDIYNIMYDIMYAM
jgi:hypothetical protein